MATYLHVLRALEYLLDKVGETYWRNWLREDITLWETKNDVSHYLFAYGGMGSFSDLWISIQNGHTVSGIQEPWVNRLLTLLRSLSFKLAQAPHTGKSIKTILVKNHFSIFRFLSRIHIFHNQSANEIQTFVNQDHVNLDGWHCLNCNYQETQIRNIEVFIAEIILPQQLSEAITDEDFIAIVDSTYSTDFTGIKIMRKQLNTP